MGNPPPEHPRVCGENIIRVLDQGDRVGTSPRMRGKHGLTHFSNVCARNIPAYAGKTTSLICLRSAPAEHPRVCGENWLRFFRWWRHYGTSPRMRGKLSKPWLVTAVKRNIPAYAGKTNEFLYASARQGGTSPRMRGKLQQNRLDSHHFRNIPAYAGKTAQSNGACKILYGTSPRMRGKLPYRQAWWTQTRNIPAYAGKTGDHQWAGLECWEHPRVCGENSIKLSRARWCIGTSPRMRGKQHQAFTGTLVHRNIPAYAGKTDHKLDSGPDTDGTSPRMRGKPLISYPWIYASRNIPAYAGKTFSSPQRDGVATEHPRVCGENPTALNGHGKTSGTSPRMRGKHVG